MRRYKKAEPVSWAVKPKSRFPPEAWAVLWLCDIAVI